jgi:4-methylaminobutanoate oxidase (formaldehyde-forming)
VKEKKHFDAIVIGAGVAGLSTAMQLARRGADVLVLERERIGNGSTGRAAGLLGQLRSTAAATRMLIDGIAIVRELEERCGMEIFVPTGSLRVAQTPERAREIADLVAMGKSIGFEIDHLPIEDVAKKLPYMKADDLIDACYCPSDGHLQPAELTSAYLKVGRELGVRYESNTPVTGIVIEAGKTVGVKTAAQTYFSPVVVNAAGPWSYLVAELAETALPAAALGHVYLTTRPTARRSRPGQATRLTDATEVDRLSPAIRDRHLRIYARPESGGLIVGMYAEETPLVDMAKLPGDFDMAAMKVRPDDLNVAMLLDAAGRRFPWITPRLPMTITTGIMTFSPDGKPFCGQMPNVEGLYYCTAFCGHGIVQSPTVGVIMADLVLTGETDYDITAITADRFFDIPGYQDRAQITAKCYEMHAGYYGRVEGQKV